MTGRCVAWRVEDSLTAAIRRIDSHPGLATAPLEGVGTCAAATTTAAPASQRGMWCRSHEAIGARHDWKQGTSHAPVNRRDGRFGAGPPITELSDDGRPLHAHRVQRHEGMVDQIAGLGGCARRVVVRARHD
jgi:hypothetical protein